MPTTTQIEVLEGKIADAHATAPPLPSTPTPVRSGDEAGGHYQSARVMRCQSCGALSYIEYDPQQTREYNCSQCSVANIL